MERKFWGGEGNMFLWIVNFVWGGGDFLKEDKIIRNLKWILNYLKKKLNWFSDGEVILYFIGGI